MRQNHSLQALQHISGGGIAIIVSLIVAMGPTLIGLESGWIQIVALVTGTVLGFAGGYILLGGIYLMLRSRAYR